MCQGTVPVWQPMELWEAAAPNPAGFASVYERIVRKNTLKAAFRSMVVGFNVGQDDCKPRTGFPLKALLTIIKGTKLPSPIE